MQNADIAAILRETMLVAVKTGGPALAVALVVGLLISLVQAATQINEQTLAFVPKVLAIGTALLLAGGFMMGTLGQFAHQLFNQMITVGLR